MYYEKDFLYTVAKYECIYVNYKVFRVLSDTESPQGILAVIGKKDEKEFKFTDDVIIMLDGIQDPGNLGTIIRTIDSVGLNQLILSENTVDPYNAKVIRSTMGAVFRVNILQNQNLENVTEELKEDGYKVIATSLGTNKKYFDVEYNKVAVIIGNEAKGIADNIIKHADIKIKIPMLGKTESLNAAVATGVVLYEYVRQKLM